MDILKKQLKFKDLDGIEVPEKVEILCGDRDISIKSNSNWFAGFEIPYKGNFSGVSSDSSKLLTFSSQNKIFIININPSEPMPDVLIKFKGFIRMENPIIAISSKGIILKNDNITINHTHETRPDQLSSYPESLDIAPDKMSLAKNKKRYSNTIKMRSLHTSGGEFCDAKGNEYTGKYMCHNFSQFFAIDDKGKSVRLYPMDRLGKPVKDYAKNREVNKKKKLKFMKDVGESLQRLIKNASSDPDKFSKTFKKSDNVKFKYTPKGWGKY